MLRIASIARETLRSAFRSRLVLALLFLLALVLLVLPRAVQADSSLEAIRRLAFTWSLGLCTLILATTTLWTACSSISSEIEDKTWASLAVTPTPPLLLWLGKWLGLVTLNAALLTIVLLGVALQAHLQGIPTPKLQPYQRIAPTHESLRAEAAKRYTTLAQSNSLPKEPQRSPEEWTSLLYQSLLDYPVSLASGHSFSWDFPCPTSVPKISPVSPAYLSLTLVSPFGSAADIAGTLILSTPNGTPIAQHEIAPGDNRVIHLPIPPNTFSHTSNTPPSSLHLTLLNNGSPDAPAALFHPAEDAALFLPYGSLAGNLSRTGLVLLSLLATLAALGTASSALFSRPVAIFAATCLAILGTISHSNLVDDGIAAEDDPIAATQPAHAHARRARIALHAIASLSQPIASAAPLDRPGDGLAIPPSLVLNALALNALALPLLFAIPSALALRRRDEI